MCEYFYFKSKGGYISSKLVAALTTLQKNKCITKLITLLSYHNALKIQYSCSFLFGLDCRDKRRFCFEPMLDNLQQRNSESESLRYVLCGRWS